MYKVMSSDKAIQLVLDVATAEVGYLEKKSNANLEDKTANAGANNYTKYWRDIKPEYQGQPWCACFVTWVFMKTFGKEVATKMLKHYPYVYCPTMASLFTLNVNPKKGDIVIFKRNGTFCHTGIVTNVWGDKFETIEGNTSGGSTIIANGGGVCRKSYYNSNLPGTKFITPDWSLAIEREELTMSQYTELKGLVGDLTAKVISLEAENRALKVENEKIINAIGGTMIYNYVDGNMPDWAKEAVQAAIDCGAVKGVDKEGSLNLNEKDIRTIVREYRRGLYNN